MADGTDETAPTTASSSTRRRRCRRQQRSNTLYPAGFPGGTAPATHYFPLDRRKEVFVGLQWKVSSPWQGHASGVNKLQFLYARGADIAMVMHGPHGGPFEIRVMPQWREHGGSWLTANVTRRSIAVGTWHRVEWYLRYESAHGAADGIVRWWVNGELAGNHTSVRFPDDDGFIEYQISPTWGASAIPSREASTSASITATSAFLHRRHHDIKGSSSRELPEPESVMLRTISDALIRTSTGAARNNVAIVDGAHRVTYAELLERALGMAALLTDRGLRKGDRVVIFLPRSVEAVVALFATWFAGGVAVIATNTSGPCRCATSSSTASARS